MPNIESGPPKRPIVITVVFLTVIFVFVATFWPEIVDLVRWIVSGVAYLFNLPGPQLPLTVGQSLRTLVFAVFGVFIPVFIIWLLLISWQSILPVSKWIERYRTAYYFFLFTLGINKAPVFIKDGKIIAELSARELMRPANLEQEKERPSRAAKLRRDKKTIAPRKSSVREKPGVLIVDFNSAVVVEDTQRLFEPAELPTEIIDHFKYLIRLEDFYRPQRILSGGVFFMHRTERIYDVVDLRKQFRLVPAVNAYTREGIEIGTNVWALFTIGQPADLLNVFYAGEEIPENLRVANLDNVWDDNHEIVTGLKVFSLSDELDAADRMQIHNDYQSMVHSNGNGGREEAAPIGQLPEPSLVPIFNSQQIFKAVFSQARDPQNDAIPWTELPARVGSDLLRKMLMEVNYDDLYQREDSDSFPLPEFKRRFSSTLRSQGILNYRMILLPRNGKGINPKAILDPERTIVSQPRPLTTSKSLRDRGIKVIASGFSDLVPPAPVYEQRLQNWNAPWERDTEIVKARSELEAMRIRTQARVQAQKDLVHSIAMILNTPDIPREALTLRLFQAIEDLAAQPQTRQLLPGDTINTLKSVHTWILPAEKKVGE